MIKTTLLIDSDILIYKATSATQQVIQWDQDICTYTCNLNDARQSFKCLLERYTVEYPGADVVMALTDKTAPNWRLKILPTYKGHRIGLKPAGLAAIREWVEEAYKSYVRPSLEADDVLGIIATAGDEIVSGKKVICSEDKDLLQIPGWHFRKGHVPVTEEEGRRWHFTQMLTGDVTDNYSGLPGCGPVKAEKILAKAEAGKEWEAVVAAYEKAGLTEADALIQARVSRICQVNDYYFDKKEVKLWTPITTI